MVHEIPPALPGRPLYLQFEGGKVYVSAHDHYHLKMLRRFKSELRRAHPDVNHNSNSGGHVRNILKARKRFLKKDAKWYVKFGLEPPTHSTPTRTKAERLFLI